MKILSTFLLCITLMIIALNCKENKKEIIIKVDKKGYRCVDF